MYRRAQQQVVPPIEITQLCTEALLYVPTQCSGSFMVPFPVVPACFDDMKVERAELVGLLASQQIPAHCDASIAPARRYHVPLQTNDRCWSFSNGVWLQLKCGLVYHMNPALVHGAVNWGATTRLHLMIDVQP